MHTTTSRDRTLLELRRLHAGRMFERGATQAAVAKQFDVSRPAAWKWYNAWDKEGKEGLKSKGHPGFPSVLTKEKKKELKQLIIAGPLAAGYTTNFWTVDRICAVTKKKLKIDLGYTRIWNTVISLGFSVQKPERRAKERNEKAITDWKLKEFPKLKKMGG